MKTSDFDFDLPPDLIAQAPLPERSASRMLVVDRASQTWSHRCVTDLPPIVQPGDVMVVNDTRVFPARLLGAREDTGGRVELLLVEEVAPHIWECFFRASSSARPGMRLVFGDRQLVATIQDRGQGGRVRAELATEAPLFDVLESIGVPPVPPYIKRDDDHPEQVAMDRNRYQTVYARERGAVAAPTAGLHLDRQLLDKLQERGIERVPLTLHVGPGTFKPVIPWSLSATWSPRTRKER